MKLTNLTPSLNFFPKDKTKKNKNKKKKNKSRSQQSISRSDNPPSFGSTSTDSSSTASIHDQTISKHELEAILRRLDVTEDELSTMLAENSNSTGFVEMTEPADESELREAFGVFDTDKDGRISAEELRDMLVALGDEECTIEECRRMIRLVDRGGDGFVCFGDFVRMMESGCR